MKFSTLNFKGVLNKVQAMFATPVGCPVSKNEEASIQMRLAQYKAGFCSGK